MSIIPEMDPYKILQLQPRASQTAIKKAYRKLAVKFHPDKVDPEDVEKATIKFHQLQKAYNFLMDKNGKAEFDLRAAEKAKRQARDDLMKSQRSRARQSLIDELDKREIAGASKSGKFHQFNNQEAADSAMLERIRRGNREAIEKRNLSVFETRKLSTCASKIPDSKKTLVTEAEVFNLEASEDEILKDLL